MIIISKHAKLAVAVFFKTVVLVLMVWIINISMVAIAVAITKPEEGYTIVYSEDEGTTTSEVYTHYHKDGEDPKFKEYENKENYYKRSIPGKLNSTTATALNLFTTISSLLLAVATYFTEFWNLGDVDANNLELRGVTYNKKRPLLIALLGYSPFILSYIVLVSFKLLNLFPNYTKIFYYVNYYAYYILSLIMPNLNLAADSLAGVLLSGLVLIPVPVICYTAYILGTKHIDIKRKLIYKKEDK